MDSIALKAALGAPLLKSRSRRTARPAAPRQGQASALPAFTCQMCKAGDVHHEHDLCFDCSIGVW